LTYAAVVRPGNLRWLAHENAFGAARRSIKAEAECAVWQTQSCAFIRDRLGGYLSEAVPS